MNNQEELEFALRFMSEHPESAVKVLEQNDIQAVASLLTNAPINYVSLVLKYMLPEFAARICNALEPGRAASILSTLDANAASIIMRLLPEASRTHVQEELPASLRKNIELLLDFSTDTVGAWMSPHMLAAASDLKSRNILKYIRSSDSLGDSEYIYVTDRKGGFLGRTRFLDILKAGEDSPVSTYMDTDCPSLPARILLEQANVHKAWEYADVLPVTNPDNRLLGLLHHHSLRQGLQQKHTSKHTPPGDKDALSGIFEVYGQSLLALLNTISESVERDN